MTPNSLRKNIAIVIASTSLALATVVLYSILRGEWREEASFGLILYLLVMGIGASFLPHLIFFLVFDRAIVKLSLKNPAFQSPHYQVITAILFASSIVLFMCLVDMAFNPQTFLDKGVRNLADYSLFLAFVPWAVLLNLYFRRLNQGVI